MSPRPTPLRLDSAACDGCGRCVSRCKPQALKVGPGYILVDWPSCDGCGKCVDACDREAIALRSAASDAPVKAATAAKSATGSKPAAPVKSAAPAKPAAPATRAPGGPARDWSLPEAVLTVLFAFALYLTMQVVPREVTHAPVWSGVALLAYYAAIAGLLFFLARRRGASMRSAFRLDVAPEWSSLGLAAAVAVGCWLVSVGYYAVVRLTGLKPPVADGPDMVTLFGPGAAGLALTMLVLAVIGPVLEEMLLRGTVLGALRSRFGPWPAIAVSAVAYAFLHASLWSLLPFAVLGVALGWLAVRSRSLWPAVAAHVLYNAVFVGAALYKALGG
jgi:membrane protease YdiL (CAAX protease family)/NAD-dependent dihydropyrimidine dehydrogenase PreA subunit